METQTREKTLPSYSSRYPTLLFPFQPGFLKGGPLPHSVSSPTPIPQQPGYCPHHPTEMSLAKSQMVSRWLHSMATVCFASLCNKIGKMWTRSSWCLGKNDKQMHAVSHIFIVGTHFVIYRHLPKYRIYLHIEEVRKDIYWICNSSYDGWWDLGQFLSYT